MHHIIMPPKPGFTVDHEDGNGLNNQRDNLRYATRQQQKANCRPAGDRQFKGVSFYKRDGNWRAQIEVDGKNRHIGYFPDERTAALAYNREALRAFGDFARLNEVMI